MVMIILQVVIYWPPTKCLELPSMYYYSQFPKNQDFLLFIGFDPKAAPSP